VALPPGALDVVIDVAGRAAAHWGLPQPDLMRMGANGIFAAGDVVLRVCRTSAPAEQALWLAAELSSAGVRVPRFVRDEVFADSGLSVFAVERLRESGPVDWPAVGAMVALVHTLEPPDVAGGYPLPWCASFPWWRFAAMLDDIGPLIDRPALDQLSNSIQRNLPLVIASRSQSGVVCHGDVHPGNVLQTADGPVLLDWDLLCHGPAGWDHGPMMTWTERWGGAPGIYEDFAEGYGESLRGQPLAEAIAELRLVAATLMRVRAGRADASAMPEAERRLRWWRGDPGAPTWQAQ
jgi:hypothetical protein